MIPHRGDVCCVCVFVFSIPAGSWNIVVFRDAPPSSLHHVFVQAAGAEELVQTAWPPPKTVRNACGHTAPVNTPVNTPLAQMRFCAVRSHRLRRLQQRECNCRGVLCRSQRPSQRTSTPGCGPPPPQDLRHPHGAPPLIRRSRRALAGHAEHQSKLSPCMQHDEFSMMNSA